jgi:hypothetical protein
MLFFLLFSLMKKVKSRTKTNRHFLRTSLPKKRSEKWRFALFVHAHALLWI